MARTCCWSVACTAAVPRRCRLFLVVFLVRIWRLNACERLIVPPERILKRLAALRLVFSLGIALLLASIWRRAAPAERLQTSAPLVLNRDCAALRRGGRLRFLLRFLRFLLCHLLDFLLPLLRRQHHDQLPPLHLGKLLP